jgi:DHA1 family tetracycline resistance protein-like MFS transporter
VIVDLIGFGIVMPVLPFLVKELGASATQLGVIAMGYAAAQFAFAPLWGRLSDRIGRRPVLLMTITGTSLSLAALGFADSLPWILAARVAAGAFAANLGVASAYIADVTPEAERTRWMGLLGASFGVGFVLGPLIGGLLVPLGYGVPMLFAAGLAALNGGFAFAVLREPEGRAATAGAARAGRLSVLRDPRVRLLFAANLLFSIAVNQLETLFAFFMRDRFGWDAHHFAWLLVAMAVVMGGVQGGAMKALSARFSERALVGFGSALLALAFLALPGMPTALLLGAPLVAAAVGRGVAQPALMSLASLAAPTGERGAVMGAFQSAGSLARVIGPLAGGVLYDRTLAGPFLLGGALLLVVAGLARRMPARVAAPDAVGESRPA